MNRVHDKLGIISKMSMELIQTCLTSIQDLVTIITNEVVIQTRLLHDEEFQRRMIDQLTSLIHRKQELETTLKEQSLRHTQAVDAQKLLQRQLQECRHYGRTLCRNTETALNSLFSSLHVTIIGDILSLFPVCKETNY